MVAIACRSALRAATVAGAGARPVRLPSLPGRRPQRSVAAKASAFPTEFIETFHMVVEKVEAVENETVSTILHTPLACIPLVALLVVLGPKASEVLSKRVGAPLVGLLFAWLLLAHPSTVAQILYDLEAALEHHPVACSIVILSVGSLLIGPYVALGAGTVTMVSMLSAIVMEKGLMAEPGAPVALPLNTIRTEWEVANAEAQSRGGAVPPPTLPAPDLSAVKLPELPSAELLAAKLPSVPELPSPPSLPSVSLPSVSLPSVSVSLPSVPLPSVSLPSVTLPSAPSMPQMPSWGASFPSFSTPAPPAEVKVAAPAPVNAPAPAPAPSPAAAAAPVLIAPASAVQAVEEQQPLRSVTAPVIEVKYEAPVVAEAPAAPAAEQPEAAVVVAEAKAEAVVEEAPVAAVAAVAEPEPEVVVAAAPEAPKQEEEKQEEAVAAVASAPTPAEEKQEEAAVAVASAPAPVQEAEVAVVAARETVVEAAEAPVVAAAPEQKVEEVQVASLALEVQQQKEEEKVAEPVLVAKAEKVAEEAKVAEVVKSEAAPPSGPSEIFAAAEAP